MFIYILVLYYFLVLAYVIGLCFFVFFQLLTSGAVRSWGLDVQEGVLAMLHLFINLTTARLKHDPVPEVLCQVLEKVCIIMYSNLFINILNLLDPN